MRKFNFSDWKDKRVAMHCKTEEEANDFCRVMHEARLKWFDGELYVEDTMWRRFKEKTIYFFNEGTCDDIEEAVHENYTILEWSDYMNKKFTKQNLKNGDVCVLRNGNTAIVIPEVGIIRFKENWDYMDNYFDNLKNFYFKTLDIVKVYRPKAVFHCSWNKKCFSLGDLVFDRKNLEPIEVTIEEIAKLKGVSVDRIKIVKGEE